MLGPGLQTADFDCEICRLLKGMNDAAALTVMDSMRFKAEVKAGNKVSLASDTTADTTYLGHDCRSLNVTHYTFA